MDARLLPPVKVSGPPMIVKSGSGIDLSLEFDRTCTYDAMEVRWGAEKSVSDAHALMSRPPPIDTRFGSSTVTTAESLVNTRSPDR